MNLFQRLTEMAERMSPRKLFAVCAAIAIIVFAIIYMLLSSLLESPAGAQQASVTAVVEAAQDIPANTVITDDMVKTVNINPEAMPKGAFTDVRAAIGKTVSVPMQEGDVLRAESIGPRTIRLPGTHSSGHACYFLLGERCDCRGRLCQAGGQGGYPSYQR